MRAKWHRKGSILIFSLWILGLLTVMTVSLGAQVRQKLTFLAGLERRDKIQQVTAAGVKKAIAVLRQDLNLYGREWNPSAKKTRFNNPGQFSGIPVGEGMCEVTYEVSEGSVEPERMYGMMDEESRINLNKADEQVVKRLLASVVAFPEEDRDRLAVAILDWRKFGSSELSGFYSDDYYENLKDPYPVKDAAYETLDELLLIRGMTREIFEKLRDFVTVHGEGRVNVNTAPKPVLLALGLDENVVEKIISVRRGLDQQEATEDDFLFQRPFDIASDLRTMTSLKDEEAAQVDQINAREGLGTESFFYRIQSVGRLEGSQASGRITCIYDARSGKIAYWKEE